MTLRWPSGYCGGRVVDMTIDVEKELVTMGFFIVNKNITRSAVHSSKTTAPLCSSRKTATPLLRLPTSFSPSIVFA